MGIFTRTKQAKLGTQDNPWWVLKGDVVTMLPDQENERHFETVVGGYVWVDAFYQLHGTALLRELTGLVGGDER